MKRSAALSPDVQSGKAMFKALVKAFGGQDAVAAEFGIRRQKISDWCVANVDDHPPLWLIDSLEERTVGMVGAPHVTAWLCRRRGGVFVPLPQGPEDAGGLMVSVVALARELGDVSRAVSEAVCSSGVDGAEVSVCEAEGMLAELAHLDRASAQMRLQLNAIAKTKSPGAVIKQQGEA